MTKLRPFWIAISALIMMAFAVPVYAQGNIDPLPQLVSSSSPILSITQRIFGKAVRITGLTPLRCVRTDANNVLVSATSDCGTGGGGGSGGGTWATTTSNVPGRLTNYPLNTTDIVCIGDTATTTCEYWFDPNTLTAYLAGNVGIGTKTPGQLLEVSGPIATSPAIRVIGSDTASAAVIQVGVNAVDLGAPGIGARFILLDAGTGGKRWDIGSGNTVSGGLTFRDATDNLNVMTMLSTGNVGIGTTSPPDLFYVNGRADITQNNVLSWREQVQGSNLDMADINGVTVDANNGYMAFRTRRAGVITDAMRIDQNGKVGIGTTSPVAAVDIVGSHVTASDSIILNTTNDASIARGFLTWKTSDGTVRSSIRSGSLVAANGLEFKAGTDSLIAAMNAGLAVGVNFAAITAPTNGLSVEGSVGIGTTSPKTSLSVSSAASNAIISVNKPNTSQIAAVKFTTDSISKFAITNSAALDGTLLIASDEFGNSPKVAVMPTGNVGIGTTTACATTCRLGVVAGVSGDVYPSNAVGLFEYSANAALAVAVPDANSAGLYFPRSTSGFYSGIEKSGTSLFLRNNDTDFVTVLSNGNVGVGGSTTPATQFSSPGGQGIYMTSSGFLGVGISTPSVPLQVNGQVLFVGNGVDPGFEIDSVSGVKILRTIGTNNARVVIGNTNDAGGTTLLVNPSAANGTTTQLGTGDGSNRGLAIVGTAASQTASYLEVNSNLNINGNIFKIASNGREGIGTTTPGSLLSIGNTTGINLTDTGTSTFSTTGGIDLRAGGCFAIAGVCISGSGGGGSGTVSTGLAGEVPWYAANGTTLTASSSASLTMGAFYATSTTATSSFAYAVILDQGTSAVIGNPWFQVGSSTSRLYVDKFSGNVGIGTAFPNAVNANAKLTVAGTDAVSVSASTTNDSALTASIFDTYAAGSRAFIGAHGQSQVTTQYGITVGGWGEVAAIANTFGTFNGLLIGTRTAASPIVFGNNSLERARILSNGNFGIGTTSAGSLLSVGTGAGGVNISSTATSTFGLGINIAAGCFSINSVCIGGSGSGSGTVGAGVAGQLGFYNTTGTAIVGSSTDSLTMGRYIATSTVASQFLYASTTAISSTGSATFGGNVGIGTTSPYAALSVVGSTGVVADHYAATSTTATSTLGTRASVGTTAKIAFGVQAGIFYGGVGTNSCMGTTTLVAGAATVSTTCVRADSMIGLSIQILGGTLGTPSVGTRVAGTSFVINSTTALDTSQIFWQIINPVYQ